MTAYFQKPFFRKTFFSYAAILIACSLIFSAAMFRQMREQERQLRQQECLSRMTVLARVLDDKFTEMEKIGLQLSSSNWVRKVRSRSDIITSGIDMLGRQDICQEMRGYHSIVRVAKSTALLLPQKEMAVDRVSFWEDERYLRSLGLDAEEILRLVNEELPGSYNALALFDQRGGGNDFLVFKQLNFSTPPELVLFFYIEGKAFEDIVLQNFKENLMGFQILQQEEALFTYQGTPQQGGGRYAMEIPSELYNWSYFFEMELAGEVAWGWLAFLPAAVLLSVLLGAGLAYFLARASYRPVSALLQQLGARALEEGEHEFEAIHHPFHSLKEEKKNLEQLSAQYYNTAQGNLLVSLLKGSFEQEAVLEQLAGFGLPFDHQWHYMAAIIHYDGPVKSEQQALDYLRLLEFGREQRYNCHLVEETGQSLVLILGGAAPEELFEAANCYKAYCDSLLGADAALVCGLPRKGLLGISKSYQMAKEQTLQEQGSYASSYYYPIDWEIQLLNQLRTGNGHVVREILAELRGENASRGLSRRDNDVVTTLVLETFLRVEADMKLNMGDIRSEFRKLLDEEDPDWPWDYLEGFAQVLCRHVDYFEEETASQLGGQLVDYVREHYCDSSLSQQRMAEEFGISRPAVSKLFKQAAKVNFIDYLHLLRIQKAKEYFDRGETDVVKVAGKTGYENEITFKRAFLRFESITPRKYVQQCKRAGRGLSQR